MGLFEAVFGRRARGRSLGGYWKELSGYTPVFSSWGGEIYESELIRAAIDAKARAASKLEVTVQGSAMPKLHSAVRQGPNSWQTWSQFLYRLMTIREVRNTAFILPVLDDMGSTVGYLTTLPNSVEVVEDTNGEPWLRFRFAGGQTAAMELGRVGIMTKFQLRDDLFGETNKALDPTMQLISMQQQGITEAIRNSATFRFMAKMNNFVKPEDLRKERDRFNREQLQDGGGGILLMPNTYSDIQQIQQKPYTVDAEQMNYIRENVMNYYGVSSDVLQSKAVGDSWSAFYESSIEPFAIQLSDVMSRMTFSDRERSTGNTITITSNRLQYMTNKDKLDVSAQMADRGLMTRDEIRAIWNLPPFGGELGKSLPVRGEYYNADQSGNPQKSPEKNKESDPNA